MSFGSYSLWSMGWGLWTFRDCPGAYDELIGVSRLFSTVGFDVIWYCLWLMLWFGLEMHERSCSVGFGYNDEFVDDQNLRGAG